MNEMLSWSLAENTDQSRCICRPHRLGSEGGVKQLVECLVAAAGAMLKLLLAC
jgi:hypothetical protein